MPEIVKLDERVISVTYNVDVWGFDASIVKTYEDYLRLKNEGRLEQVAIYHDRGHNLVVNAGLDQIVDLMVGTDTSSFTHAGVGSSSTAAAAGQTDLQTAIGSRVTITNRYKVSTGQAHFDTFFSSSSNNGTWREIATFNASSGGDMLQRYVISDFTKDATKSAVTAVTVTLA